MPKISVTITYDKPLDKLWLNPDALVVALSKYCPRTKFVCEWAPGGNPWADDKSTPEEAPL